MGHQACSQTPDYQYACIYFSAESDNHFRTFESSVIGKLLAWAAASIEKSVNQPTLPHAIIALNATDMGVDPKEWDVDYATQTLMSNVAQAIHRDPKYGEYADYWMRRGRVIRTTKDLLLCYYSSITVVRIPTKGRYMLIDEQAGKLHKQITLKCSSSYFARRKARMLSNSDELNVYLQYAFDHFSQDLDTPFNFIEVAFKNNPIPMDFGGNILKLAVAIRKRRNYAGRRIFQELAGMVASCVMLDCVRHNLKGVACSSLFDGATSNCFQVPRTNFSSRNIWITVTPPLTISAASSRHAHMLVRPATFVRM